ncbi:MAG: twin-arginine translocase subunit TatB [Rhizobiales bacterium]|nr:twin-arginine translocase subunit TatB [Hyphomicrobiales bacterium]
MFDFGVGYSELFVLALVAVIVIGPKDLPRVLRMFGQFMNKARRMAGEFQVHVDAAMKDSGVQGLKKDLDQARGAISQVATTPSSTVPNIIPPVVSSSYGLSDKSFETFFGAEPRAGETRVAGALVEEGAAGA